ncbi:putative bifunctional diguanylate cyclase/phosphodiesterase [Mycobacterium paraterrae]|uniref:Bifunctional diguanylate cyclase/phosphodiesterase n=1 Tax=Mycobacterium paraterrae TaxID=577492 RepID=A0ABY3VLC7_9MYCO|nr:bifunctional diguanylate cyclase/phosphodiesterase [Mycobacterium paraterrae]UMB68298.1 bifunctional diguanylate cyclase/phosphodiesterase [Mycobacterium paraterrae]
MTVRRRLLGAGLLLLPLVVGIALALELTLRWGGEGVVRAVDSLTLVASSIYATAWAVFAARCAAGAGRRAWTLLSVALGVGAAGNVIWALHLGLLQDKPFPASPGLWYLACTLLMAGALTFFPAGPLRGSRLRNVLDGITAGLCLLLLMWIVALHSVYDTYAANRDVPVLRVLLPIGDLTVLTTVVLITGRAEPRYRRELWLLGAAILLLTATNTGYVSLIASGRFHAGSLLDLGWFAASIAFAAAAQMSRRSSSTHRPETVSSNTSLWLPYVPLLLAGTVGPAIVMSGFESLLVPLLMISVVSRQVVAAAETRRLLADAAQQALRDPLTGLPNRTLFHDRLTHALTLRQRDERSVAVVSIDIDDFKLVNDSLGHPVADNVLVRVGQRIADSVRPGDTVARLGGDEFALLLEGPEDQSYVVAGRVVEAFEQPLFIAGETILVRPSVGIALASPDEPDIAPHLLLKRADMAMYAAKRSRSSGMHSFSPDMELAVPDVTERAGRAADRPAADGAAQIRLLGELRRAIDHAELTLVYQPKIHLRSGRVVGLEALLRWPHPELGELRPDTFMGLVRQHGLMRQVTELVVTKALDDAVRWQTAGVDTAVAVNVFAPDLKDAGLPDALCGALQSRHLSTALLTVEITEDLIVNDIDRVTTVLRRLRDVGIRVAIDDFGSGFSALSYLRDLPVDEVKLDRQFISSITDDKRAAAVVRAVIDLTHELDVTVVAEGIEDAATADWLREHGCDIGQGYHIGAPVAASMVPQLIGAQAR